MDESQWAIWLTFNDQLYTVRLPVTFVFDARVIKLSSQEIDRQMTAILCRCLFYCRFYVVLFSANYTLQPTPKHNGVTLSTLLLDHLKKKRDEPNETQRNEIRFCHWNQCVLHLPMVEGDARKD